MAHDQLLTLRLPTELVRRLEALASDPAIRQLPEIQLLGNVTKSAVTRFALLRGLDQLEAETKSKPKSKALKPAPDPHARALGFPNDPPKATR
jgi:hypothetical protein